MLGWGVCASTCTGASVCACMCLCARLSLVTDVKNRAHYKEFNHRPALAFRTKPTSYKYVIVGRACGVFVRMKGRGAFCSPARSLHDRKLSLVRMKYHPIPHIVHYFWPGPTERYFDMQSVNSPCFLGQRSGDSLWLHWARKQKNVRFGNVLWPPVSNVLSSSRRSLSTVFH